MSWMGDLLRRARIRGVKEGKVQTARAESTEADAKDDVERWQDYGFAANPVDGQGLVLNVAGHTLVVRLDRIGERPQLDAYEVALWHKEGHMVRLKAGKVVEVACDVFRVNAAQLVDIRGPQVSVSASGGISLTTPQVAASGGVSAVGTVAGQAVAAATSLKVAGKEMAGHTHGNVQNGSGSSGGPN